jgi:hypothetical protein
MTVRTEIEPVDRGSGVDKVLQERLAGNGRRGFPLKDLRCSSHVWCLLHIRPVITIKYFAFSYEMYLCVLHD